MRCGKDCASFIQLKNSSGNSAEVTLSKYSNSKAVDPQASNGGSAVEANDAIPLLLPNTCSQCCVILLISPKQASSMATSHVTSRRKLRYVVHELTNTITASLVSLFKKKKNPHKAQQNVWSVKL